MDEAVREALAALRHEASALGSEDLSFPTGADAALRVMRAVDNPDVGLDALARIVVAEPLLSAKVIRIANSVAYNASGNPITDVRQAVMRVGMDPIRTLALALTLDQMRQSHRLGAARHLANRLWERSVQVAALAHVVARNLAPAGSVTPDEAMFAGIVHDLGRFYLLGLAAAHPALIANPGALHAGLDELQREFGPAVLRAAGIPDPVLAAIIEARHFTGPMPPATLSDVLFIAAWLAPSADPAIDPEQRERERSQESAALGLDHATIRDMVTASGDEIYAIVLALEA